MIAVYLETGSKRSFAGALDWPGWCRSGRDEAGALQALLDYGPRYAQVLNGKIDFQAPADRTAFNLIERLPGSAGTDFGAPGGQPEADRRPLEPDQLERSLTILAACWQALDQAARQAAGKELQKGPRGGGRDLEKMLRHVLEADLAYLAQIAWKYKPAPGLSLTEELAQVRQAVRQALETAVTQGLPERGPRGGIYWPARYFIRRTAWHTLDHAWEIEDRII